MAAGLHPPCRRLGFTLGEIRDMLGPAEARFTGDIVRAAEARLEAIDAQLAELMLQRYRLRRLIQVCEHGSGDDCAALHISGFPGRDDLMREEEK